MVLNLIILKVGLQNTAETMFSNSEPNLVVDEKYRFEAQIAVATIRSYSERLG